MTLILAILQTILEPTSISNNVIYSIKLAIFLELTDMKNSCVDLNRQPITTSCWPLKVPLWTLLHYLQIQHSFSRELK